MVLESDEKIAFVQLFLADRLPEDNLAVESYHFPNVIVVFTRSQNQVQKQLYYSFIG